MNRPKLPFIRRIDASFEKHARSILLASSVYLIVSGFILIVSMMWINDDRTPSVRVLGSGSRLSVLIVSGNARMLIAGGNDASAFSNALASALHPTSRRIDVVILSGAENDQAVVARVRRDFPDAVTYMLAGELNRTVQNFELDTNSILSRSTMFSLPGGVSVTVDPGSDDSGWNAEVHTDSSFVFLTSDPGSSKPPRIEPTAVVLTSRFDRDVEFLIAADAVVCPGESSPCSDSTRLIDQNPTGLWLVRVYDAGSEQLTFTDRGLALPPSAILIESDDDRSEPSLHNDERSVPR